MHLSIQIVLIAAALAVPSVGRAQTSTTTTAEDGRETETIKVVGSRETLDRTAGSNHVLGEEELNRFEYDDISRVLVKVPGVYIRDEDGFGLRPNIGIRGANSDRSSKIVLLEDGVLLGPAPYSAPAAYYVPLATRMVGLEVFKGPAAVRTGPNTVGGAVNYITADIPSGHQGMVDVAGGEYGYLKGHFRYGYGSDHFGVLVEGVRLRSTGFKVLDGGGDTGFDKSEVMAKLRLQTDPNAVWLHRLELKLGWADEGSNETYLGLTQSDFRATPYRRYAASALDRMEWERTQIQLSYTVFGGGDFEARLVGYRHELDRAWFKLNSFASPTLDGGFTSGANPGSVLDGQVSGTEAPLIGLLRGEYDSDDPDLALTGGRLRLGTNDRQMVSQGVQLDGDWKVEAEGVDQRIRFGARLHYDEIRRNHTERTYRMTLANDAPAQLVEAPGALDTTLQNVESALAFSAYIQDEITLLENLTLSPGLRVEVIHTESERLGPMAEPKVTNDYEVLIPGFGAFYRITEELGVLAGVHRGFSPLAPGQPDDVDVESSINYEVGARYARPGTQAELIGYLSDYENLLLNCTFGQGCPPDQVGKQFNAGSTLVYGLEASVSQGFRLAPDLDLHLSGGYTLTIGELGDDFNADGRTITNPQFSEAEPGDRLPYVPEHQANAATTVTYLLEDFTWSFTLSYTFVDRMRDFASGADEELRDEAWTDAQHVVDLSLGVETEPGGRFYLLVNNLFDQAYIASRRPFGARPGAPRTVRFGYSHRFGL